MKTSGLDIHVFTEASATPFIVVGSADANGHRLYDSSWMDSSGRGLLSLYVMADQASDLALIQTIDIYIATALLPGGGNDCRYGRKAAGLAVLHQRT